MKTLTINGVEYKIKYTIRALFIFEKITGKSFKIETLLDNYIFFYSIILANNTDKILDWDEFINALDEDPKIFAKINEIVEDENKRNSLFDNSNDGDDSKKK